MKWKLSISVHSEKGVSDIFKQRISYILYYILMVQILANVLYMYYIVKVHVQIKPNLFWIPFVLYLKSNIKRTMEIAHEPES